ncbi:MAG: hypothetical protein ACRDWY_17870, partial [Actinomycetes bacterium]
MRGRVGRGVGALFGALVVGLGAPPAAADPGHYATYPGPGYDHARTHLTPTAAKPQNKLWWHDGSWWALMYHRPDRTVRVAELMADHSWRVTETVLTDRPVGVGDALASGSSVHVLNNTLKGLVVSSLTFDRKDREFRLDRGSQKLVATRGTSSAALAQDSRGRLWVGYVSSGIVRVAHST